MFFCIWKCWLLQFCNCVLCLTSSFKVQVDISAKSWNCQAARSKIKPYLFDFLSTRHSTSLNSLHAGPPPPPPTPPTNLICFDNPLVVCEDLQNETRQPRRFSLHLVYHLPNLFYTLHPTFMSSNGIAIWRQGVLIHFGHFHLSDNAKKASRHVL